MGSITIGLIVLAFVFGGALLGVYLRTARQVTFLLASVGINSKDGNPHFQCLAGVAKRLTDDGP